MRLNLQLLRGQICEAYFRESVWLQQQQDLCGLAGVERTGSRAENNQEVTQQWTRMQERGEEGMEGWRGEDGQRKEI